MFMPKNEGGDFTPPPADTHIAICYRVLDLGTQQVDWKGQTKHQRKVLISWELPNALMDTEEGPKPYSIHQRYTLSSSEKSNLRKDLEAWRGLAFQESDFGEGGFDIRNLLSKTCLIGVIHAENNGKVYANIASISKIPKGLEVPSQVNPNQFLDLDNFDQEGRDTFERLSDGLKDTISKSPEYQEAIGAVADQVIDQRQDPRDNAWGENDHGNQLEDEIPF